VIEKMKLQDKSGLRLLLERYRAFFRTGETRKYYREKDFKKAERKFLKYALEQRRIEMQEKLFE
jgi:plasmid replication initiation protein